MFLFNDVTFSEMVFFNYFLLILFQAEVASDEPVVQLTKP